jgi:hypothetical protein
MWDRALVIDDKRREGKCIFFPEVPPVDSLQLVSCPDSTPAIYL